MKAELAAQMNERSDRIESSLTNVMEFLKDIQAEQRITKRSIKALNEQVEEIQKKK